VESEDQEKESIQRDRVPFPEILDVLTG